MNNAWEQGKPEARKIFKNTAEFHQLCVAGIGWLFLEEAPISFRVIYSFYKR